MSGKGSPLKGEVRLPGDKSISHRALMIPSLSRGTSRVRNLLRAEDVGRTWKMMEMIGVEIGEEGDDVLVTGRGAGGFVEPPDILDAGNSGTTIRIGSGMLASIDGLSLVTGDRYLRNRPMERIVTPLKSMGAQMDGRGGGRYPPLAIRGGELHPVMYEMPQASAQVKSSILLAAASSGISSGVHEPLESRDHTERMLRLMGGKIVSKEGWIQYEPGKDLLPAEINVPSDFSSAAFFIVAAILLKFSEIVVKDVLLNPLRCGLASVLTRMGGELKIEGVREESGEEVGDIIVRYSELAGTVVTREEIPLLIDEIPILAVAASFAEGITEIRGAAELRVKESDRIGAMVSQLSSLGVSIEELPDGMVIEGGEGYRGGDVATFGDHRVAMALEIFGLASGRGVNLDDRQCIATSFPRFYPTLEALGI